MPNLVFVEMTPVMGSGNGEGRGASDSDAAEDWGGLPCVSGECVVPGGRSLFVRAASGSGEVRVGGVERGCGELGRSVDPPSGPS